MSDEERTVTERLRADDRRWMVGVVKEAVAEELDDRRSIEPEVHTDHHEWVTHQIEKDKQRERRWEKVSQTVLGWLVIGALSTIGIAVYKVFILREWGPD